MDKSEAVYLPPGFNEEESSSSEDGKSSDKTENALSNERLLEKCKTYLSSVDGGKLDLRTAQGAAQDVRKMMRALETEDLTDLLQRMKIRDKFLGKYCVAQNYAPLRLSDIPYAFL